VFFGSARVRSMAFAESALKRLKRKGGSSESHREAVHRSERGVDRARFYEDARRLAYLLTTWTMSLNQPHHRFCVCSGGGPGGQRQGLDHSSRCRTGTEPPHVFAGTVGQRESDLREEM